MLMYLGGHSKIGNDRKFPHFFGGVGGGVNNVEHVFSSSHKYAQSIGLIKKILL